MIFMHIPYKTIFISIALSGAVFMCGYMVAGHAHAQMKQAMHEHDRKADIFHLDKERASEYKTINPGYYEHSGILSASAAFLVTIFLVYVYYQNYLYKKKNDQND
jgi:hypothetical protein